MEKILIAELGLDSTFYNTSDIADLNITLNFESKIGTFDTTKDLFTNITEGYEPVQKDKLFFGKAVTIPRVKLKNLTKDYKIKATTKIEDATAIFVSNNAFSKYTDDVWNYKVTTQGFKTFIEDAVSYGVIDEYYVEKVKDALEFYTNDYIAISYHTRGILEHSHIPFRINNGTSFSSQRMYYISDTHFASYTEILSATCPVYNESDLLKYLNGDDALAIEENMYESLCEMFDSSDRDNHTMAMEIMANSNFEGSLLYLCLLFHDYSSRLQESRTKSHVNFKSLLAMMDISGGYFYLSVDDILEKLKHNGQLTKENVDIVLKKLGEKITDNGDTKYFRVKTISLSEDMLAVLNLNYEYKVSDDFVPQTPEIEEEVIQEPVSLEEEAVLATVEETVEEVVETVEEDVKHIEIKSITKELIDFDNVIVESKTNNDGYFL
jgi:hypothetical protein